MKRFVVWLVIGVVLVVGILAAFTWMTWGPVGDPMGDPSVYQDEPAAVGDPAIYEEPVLGADRETPGR